MTTTTGLRKTATAQLQRLLATIESSVASTRCALSEQQISMCRAIRAELATR